MAYTLTGTATNGVDYATPGVLTVAADGTGSLTVTTTADGSTEGPETLILTANGLSSSVTINDTSLTGSGGATTTNISAALLTGTTGAGADTFNIAAGNYTATIAGFGQAGADKLVFFPGASVSIVNDANQGDGIQQFTAFDPATFATATITLTGISATQDANLFNATSSFVTQFGAGSIA